MELGLVPLAHGSRAPGDAATGAEVQPPVLDPEGADGHVELALAAVGVDPADRTAVHAAGTGSSRAMRSSAASLGAPVTDPGREGGGDDVAPRHVRPQPAGHGRDQVHQARVVLDRAQGGHLDRPPLAHPPQVAARGRRSSRFGPVLRQEARRVGRRALDRRRGHEVAVAGGTARRPRRRGIPPTAAARPPSRAPGCPGRGRRRARRCRRRAAGGGQPAGEVHLVDVAGGDGGPDGVDPGAELVAVERGGPPSGSGPARAARARAGRPVSANLASTGAPSNGSTTAHSPRPSSAARSTYRRPARRAAGCPPRRGEPQPQRWMGGCRHRTEDTSRRPRPLPCCAVAPASAAARGVHRRAAGPAHPRARRRGRDRRTPRGGTPSTLSPPTWSCRWATWACSASRSRSTAAAAPT